MTDSILFWFSLTVLSVAAIFWPRLGLLARWRRYTIARQRILAEDALKHLHAITWRGQLANLQSLAGALQLALPATARLVRQMETQGWVVSRANGLSLTPDGERLAVEVIRAHRLWERYLADEARMPLTDIHAEAERREHRRAPETVQELAAAMGYPEVDPHGDPIPDADGQLPTPIGTPLTDWPVGAPARIVHLEDEPAEIFSQISAENISPGLIVRLIEANAQRLVLSDGDKLYTLAPVVAANIFVTTQAAAPEPGRTLNSLHPGQPASISRLDDSLQGFTRRRLLDLGLTPGTIVSAERRSLFGDPIAYRVRGTLIALRSEQAEKVLINLPSTGS